MPDQRNDETQPTGNRNPGELTEPIVGKKKETGGYVPHDLHDEFVESTGSRTPVQGEKAGLPTLGFRGWVRFIWRQLTSMRVALMLLMFLAVAAIPGSIFPQRAADPTGVAQYIQDNPSTGPWLDRLWFFEVFASPWFAAIYILLFISLVGCILPRVKVHYKALRSAPPKTPRVFKRFPATQSLDLADTSAEQTAQSVAQNLRGAVKCLPKYRSVVSQEKQGVWTVSAERGYLKETGNLLFHISLLGILLSFGAGQLLEYRGQAIVVEGRGFVNSQVAYNTFEHGAWFNEDSMEPFVFTLDKFESQFRAKDAFAQDFTAYMTVETPEGETRQDTIKVNYPMNEAGAKIYLMGNGHAPTVTVRDASGEIAFSGAVPFLTEDSVYTSKGVIKVPDVSTGEQLGLVGYLLPTAEIENGQMKSIYPEALNPVLVLDLYKGNLGLDDGIPQNVYRLSTENLEKVTNTDANPDPIVLALGQTADLPDGLGTIEFESIPRYAAFDLRYDPTLMWLLASSLLCLAGLALSLFTPRRRVWARVADTDEGVHVELAGLARGDDTGLAPELTKLSEKLLPAPHLTKDEKAAQKLSRRQV